MGCHLTELGREHQNDQATPHCLHVKAVVTFGSHHCQQTTACGCDADALSYREPKRPAQQQRHCCPSQANKESSRDGTSANSRESLTVIYGGWRLYSRLSALPIVGCLALSNNIWFGEDCCKCSARFLKHSAFRRGQSIPTLTNPKLQK